MAGEGLTEFATKLAVMALEEHAAQRHAIRKAAGIIEKRAKEKIGEYQDAAGDFVAWAELADSTKEDRARKGYPEDEPLLRDGTLRDSISTSVTVDGLEAAIGSALDIAVYQELGTNTIPPRSFLAGAAVEEGSAVRDAIGEIASMALIGGGVFGGRLAIK